MATPKHLKPGIESRLPFYGDVRIPRKTASVPRSTVSFIPEQQTESPNSKSESSKSKSELSKPKTTLPRFGYKSPLKKIADTQSSSYTDTKMSSSTNKNQDLYGLKSRTTSSLTRPIERTLETQHLRLTRSGNSVTSNKSLSECTAHTQRYPANMSKLAKPKVFTRPSTTSNIPSSKTQTIKRPLPKIPPKPTTGTHAGIYRSVTRLNYAPCLNKCVELMETFKFNIVPCAAQTSIHTTCLTTLHNHEKTTLPVNYATPSDHLVRLHEVSSLDSINTQSAVASALLYPIQSAIQETGVYQPLHYSGTIAPQESCTAESVPYFVHLETVDPNSASKKLINSFTVKEQLSPTAELRDLLANPHAKPDVARTVKSVYSCRGNLNVQILKGIPSNTTTQQSGNTIAEPLTRKDHVTVRNVPDGTQRRSKEPPLNTRTANVTTGMSHLKPGSTLPLPQKKSTRRGIQYEKHRRIDSRQEKQMSPKHKPDIREDSPIRVKEPFYGNGHIPLASSQIKNSRTESQTNHTSAVAAVCIRDERYSADMIDGISSLSGSCPTDPAIRCGTPIPPASRADKDRVDTYSAPLPNGRRVWLTQTKMDTRRTRTRGISNEAESKLATNFASILRIGLPPCPPDCVLTAGDTSGHSALSKVTVAVRCKSTSDSASVSSSYITADSARGQLYLRDPSNQSNIAPSCRRQVASVPKFFAFDNVFGGDALQGDVCKNSVWGTLQSVLHGSDGCIISYGHSRTGKSNSMIGDDSSSSEFGIIPTAISWLYQLIHEQKAKTGARFSIRVSILEIRGKSEELVDLLSYLKAYDDNDSNQGPQLIDDPVYGAQLDNLSEHRAPDAEKAGFYLDTALTALHQSRENGSGNNSHLLFTLHVYQHHLESKPQHGSSLVAGGRSRLHLIDIGPCAKSSSDGSALTLAALGSIITALLNGQKHFPHKESRLATLLKESVGNACCKTCILVHVSSQSSQYMETLQILQLAARIHRMKVRRRHKFSSNSSDDTGSTNSRLRRRKGIKMGTSASLSDPDVSSSEQSIDTVIYVPDSRGYNSHNSSPVYRGKADYQTIPNSPKPSAWVSPYEVPGAVKKRLSDDETSSEGRRRMPRTNARVWPKLGIPDPKFSPTKSTGEEVWLDSHAPVLPRDQWMIAGTASPSAIPHGHHPKSMVAQQHVDIYQQSQIPAHNQHLPPPWVPGNQGDPNLYSTDWNGNTSSYQWEGNSNQPTTVPYGAIIYPECHKQELWVDGPTEFTKNIEVLTNKLAKDDLSPTKKHHKHHHDEREFKHHHRSQRKSKDGKDSHRHKHCAQCGADIKKSKNSSFYGSSSSATKGVYEEEPTISVKPFVKDWVMRHSTPVKTLDSFADENTDESLISHSDPSNGANLSDQFDAADDEMSESEQLQLTIELIAGDGVADSNAIDANPGHEKQDDIQIDDSVSNVTADERVGYESKGESLCDENSLAEDMIEVCDAACQTEFTDSETQSMRSNQTDKMAASNESAEAWDDVRSLTNFDRKQGAVEDGINFSLQEVLLRKPDGASNPNLHKETITPSNHTESSVMPSSKAYSHTLPRDLHLVSMVDKQERPDSNTDTNSFKTVRLQPYLCSSNQEEASKKNLTLPKPTTSTLPASPKSVGKIKKPTVFSKQISQHKNELESSSPASLLLDGKKKASRLPSVKLPTRNKDGAKVSAAAPKSGSEKVSKEKSPASNAAAEKKSFLSVPKSSSLPPPSIVATRIQQFDSTVSPYRHYVLPRPSYALSDVCSDNSSCLSSAQAHTKCSVSSGYESLVPDSTDDRSPTPPEKKTHKSSDKSNGPWIGKTKSATSSDNVLDVLELRKKESCKLSEDLKRQARVDELLYLQEELKKEMTDAKRILMVPSASLNFDLHVASQIDRRNESGYVEALEKETSILQRRVDACKSHLMLVTSLL